MMYDYGMGWGAGGWLIAIGVVAVVIGLILLVVWAVGRSSGGTAGGGTTSGSGFRPTDAGTDQALAILRERFARGEITEAEYEHARQVLATR
jgi:putative membrane protein